MFWTHYPNSWRPEYHFRGHGPAFSPALWTHLESTHSRTGHDGSHQQTDATSGKYPAETVRIRPDVSFSQQAFVAAPVFPRGFLEWKTLSDRFRLDEPHGWEAVLATAAFLAGSGIVFPQQMADILPDGVEVLCGAADFAVLIRELWGVARTTLAPASSSSSFCLVTNRWAA